MATLRQTLDDSTIEYLVNANLVDDGVLDSEIIREEGIDSRGGTAYMTSSGWLVHDYGQTEPQAWDMSHLTDEDPQIVALNNGTLIMQGASWAHAYDGKQEIEQLADDISALRDGSTLRKFEGHDSLAWTPEDRDAERNGGMTVYWLSTLDNELRRGVAAETLGYGERALAAALGIVSEA